jgi:predicted N-acetyltransferase YhbS
VSFVETILFSVHKPPAQPEEQLMPDIVIEPIQPHERPAATELLSRAMSVLPENRAVFRGRNDRLQRMFRMMANSAHGQVFVAKDARQVVGVMRIVEWPQCKEIPFLQRLKLLPIMLWVLKDTFPRAMKFQSVWARHDPQKPHWHLDPLAVLPERQGQGIGSMLLRHFCEYVDRLGSAAYLETGTRDNVRLYERFGFSIIGEAPVFDVPTWFMWRDPPGK